MHCAGFWALGEGAESPSGGAGMYGGPWPVSAGRLQFVAGRDAFAWESTAGRLGPPNEELQPRGTSSPVVQPGLGVRRRCCRGGDSEVLTACTPRRGLWSL